MIVNVQMKNIVLLHEWKCPVTKFKTPLHMSTLWKKINRQNYQSSVFKIFLAILCHFFLLKSKAALGISYSICISMSERTCIQERIYFKWVFFPMENMSWTFSVRGSPFLNSDVKQGNNFSPNIFVFFHSSSARGPNLGHVSSTHHSLFIAQGVPRSEKVLPCNKGP